jgi:hypothetical protein
LAGQLAANHPDDALQYLREAINRGYKDADGLMADPDLEKLRQLKLAATRRRTQNACPEEFSPIGILTCACIVCSDHCCAWHQEVSLG